MQLSKCRSKEEPIIPPTYTCLCLCSGWIFGERLHDQERGWFPSSMGEEILNPKIRAQNLKECFRVHKSDDSQRRKLGSRNRQ